MPSHEICFSETAFTGPRDRANIASMRSLPTNRVVAMASCRLSIETIRRPFEKVLSDQAIKKPLTNGEVEILKATQALRLTWRQTESRHLSVMGAKQLNRGIEAGRGGTRSWERRKRPHISAHHIKLPETARI